jgi:crotonobetainyl-CoA:carnitine CoA-transferase CaiB-like acyl-CoA transferase
MRRPLDGITILSLEQYGAGPFGTLHLADLGARIIKIEDPSVGGDVGRYVPPYMDGEDSLFFETFNRNKESISLDLTTESGRKLFERLVAVSDGVYSNLRGDVPAKLKIMYDDLKHINPAIVCCSLSGYGMSGPRQNEPGYDYMLQGLAGWMSLTGDPSGPPTKSGLSLVDFSGGFVAALALVSGIHAARRDGVGMDCDISLYDTALALTSYVATWHMTGGHEPLRFARSAHPSLVPFQIFPTKDSWIVLGCAKEKFYQRLTEVMQRSDLVEDPRFSNFTVRFENREILVPLLDEVLTTRTTADWLEVLVAAGVPCAPVNTIEQAWTEEHTAAREMIAHTDHPKFGDVRAPSSPVNVGPKRTDHTRAPQRGEHTEKVLQDLLGMTDAEFAELTDQGAFGDSK